jgi:hypothetical protein
MKLKKLNINCLSLSKFHISDSNEIKILNLKIHNTLWIDIFALMSNRLAIFQQIRTVLRK